MRFSVRVMVAVAAVFALVVTACGDDDDVTSAATDRPTVVVTTNILGDVVENLVGEEMNVVTIMPVGADPHDFQASAQQVAEIGEAEVLVVNGAAFEEGLLDVIESAEDDGVPVFEAIGAVSTVEFGEGSHDEHDDEEEHGDDEHEAAEDHEGEEHADDDEHEEEGEEHEGEDHADEGDHEHEGADPHFFTDPARMAVAAEAVADFLIDTVEGVDAAALRSNADAYIAELEAVDTEVAQTLEGLSEDQRVLVTNHEVFGYFADRYDFEVVGTVIPGGSTVDTASAQALAELAETIEDEGVPAIFADTSSSEELAQTLADEVGEVEVVEVNSESLGDQDSDGATYVKMVRTYADRIAAALGA